MMSKIRDSRDEGFTLIELLVVVIIIGILAAIAIPVFLNQREKAYAKTAESDLRNAAIEVESYFVDNNEYPPLPADFAAIPTLVNSPNVTMTYELDGLNGQAYCIAADHSQLDGVGDDRWYDSDGGGVSQAPCA